MSASNLEKMFQAVIAAMVDSKALLRMDLRDRMAVMANLGRELIRHGISKFFVAAVITESEVVFPATVVTDDHHKEEIRNSLVELANKVNALCVLIVMEGWAVKGTAENFQPLLRHSEHPNRQEVLLIDAKDYFEHLTGMQFTSRSEGNVEFGELQIGSNPKSWLTEWQVKPSTSMTC